MTKDNYYSKIAHMLNLSLDEVGPQTREANASKQSVRKIDKGTTLVKLEVGNDWFFRKTNSVSINTGDVKGFKKVQVNLLDYGVKLELPVELIEVFEVKKYRSRQTGKLEAKYYVPLDYWTKSAI